GAVQHCARAAGRVVGGEKFLTFTKDRASAWYTLVLIRSCFDKPVLSLSKDSARTGVLCDARSFPLALSLSKGERARKAEYGQPRTAGRGRRTAARLCAVHR